MNAQIKIHLLVIVFSVCYFVFAFATYKDYGITSDEQLGYTAGKTYITYLFSKNEQRATIVKTSQPKENPASFPHFRLYPGIVALINYKSSYEVAHLINLAFGYVGFLVVYLLVYNITGSRLAILAPLLLFLNPHYLGHIPANPKDIPFSTVYLLCIYLMVRIRKFNVGTPVILGLLLALVTGMRFVGIGLFGFYLLVLFFRSKVGLFAVTAITSLTFLYIIWPYLWGDPIPKMLSLVSGAQDFSYWDRAILFNGNMITKDERPWYYLFTYILYKIPVIILGGFVGSLIVKSKKTLIILAIVFFNLLMYLILQPTIYNEMRHFLYLIPLFTVLATVFFIKLVENKNTALSRAGFLIVVLGLAKMSYDFITLHPYQYVYFNEFAGGTAQASKNFELDYWSASYKESSEYLRDLSLTSPTPLKVYACNPTFGIQYYARKTFILVNNSAEADYYICDYMNALKRSFALEYKVVYEVKRKGAVLSYVAKTIK